MLDDRERKDLYRLLVARSDLMASLSAARYIIQHVNDLSDDLWVPLQDAAIISYARLFTANKPFGPLPKRYAKFDSQDPQKLHDDLIELRHKTIAHSDADIRRIIVVPPGVKIGPVTSGKKGGVAVSTQKLPPAMSRDIEKLNLDVGRRINRDAEELSERLLEDADLPDYPFDLLTGERVDS